MSESLAHRDPFDPEHCELERNPGKLRQYIQMLESALGHQTTVVAMLEIGSYAKGEAVPSSDIDTRVYVTSPTVYLFNIFGQLGQPRYESLVKERGLLPRQDYDWFEFNDPVSEQISQALSSGGEAFGGDEASGGGEASGNIEFGFVDQRYAEFELDHLDQLPSIEHALLFQSNVLYDPLGFLARRRRALRGRIYGPLVESYAKQYLDQPYHRVYDAIKPNPWDDYKLEKSGQIIWVQRAVRCLRNAVAAKTYVSTGTFLYKKTDVIRFYRQHLPEDLEFVQTLYDWKTDPTIRAEMAQEFKRDRAKCFERFRALMPQLEDVVAKVKDLSTIVTREPPRERSAMGTDR